MAKCLVLGANGFIGSHLVDKLVIEGHSVRAFDRFEGKDPVFNQSDLIEIFSGDFLNRADLQKAVDGIEYVFHFISTTTPATAENDPLIDIDTNIRMSVELFQVCADKMVKKVIFASTGGAIYGLGTTNPHREGDLTSPVSPYAIGKLTIEHYLRYFRVKFGLESVVFRISNPYGERQPLHRKQGVIPIFIENICQGRPITILGDGSMIRDYIYVGDVASTIASVFDKNTLYDTYNLGTGVGVTVSELIEVINQATGIQPKTNTQPVPPTFINKVVLDTSRLHKEFKISKVTSLKEGVRKTYEYVDNELKRSIDE